MSRHREADSLPADEQNRVAHWLLEKLRDEEHWTHQFVASPDALSMLADEARTDLANGRTTELDLTSCEIARDAALPGSYRRLPSDIQELAKNAYRLFQFVVQPLNVSR